MKAYKSFIVRLALILIMAIGSLGILPLPVHADAVDVSNSDRGLVSPVILQDQAARVTNPASSFIPSSALRGHDLQTANCEPDSGWMWTNGPTQPDTAIEVQRELSQLGIDAVVEARSYGETDDCGTYSQHGVDFTIALKNKDLVGQASQKALTDAIIPILVEYGKPSLGNVKLITAQGDVIPVDLHDDQNTVQPLDADPLPADAITKQVYVLVYDPLLSNGQTLSQYMHWNDHATITQQTIDFFKQYSNNKVNYSVVNTTVITSGWPELIDGFRYTEQEYMAVWANPNLHHTPTEVNYNKIVNDPAFDICGKLNRGEIDEVWMYGGPWFGYYKSTLVGPGSYYFNSFPVSGLHNCNKILPIMGPSVERTVQEAVHNFTHRTEDTMKKVYGSWSQNSTSHSWNKFALVQSQSPNYSYGGCGSSHYPHNGTSGYNYDNLLSVLSNCADFANYPNLGDPLLVAQPVNCSAWGCMELDYFRYWFGHMPANVGCGPDNVANNWWNYIADPKVALFPSNACQTDMHLISGTTGVGGMTLSYTDGTPKNAVSDSYGNYFLMVSNHWSGTVTPSKAGYAFTPASMDYVDIQVDQHSQNYEGTVFTYTISGNAGIGGVTLSYTEGTPKTAVADGNGNYSFVVPYNWSGTVTPAKAGYLFTPTSKSYSLVRADQASQNYVTLVTISGNAGVGAATLSYTDGTLKAATADSGGNYALNVSYNWSGAITPFRTGYTFTPVSKSYPNVETNQTGQDYTATAITFTISGNTGVGSATLNYTDGTAKTVLADGNGDYSFTVSYNWSGTVTPVKPGYLFTPVSRSYSYTLANQTAQNYTATSGRVISGNAGVSGATLSYNNGGAKSALADVNGDYIFTVSNNWSGTVTPSKTGYIFTPASRSYANLQADQSVQNYSVTPLYTISGSTGIGSVALTIWKTALPNRSLRIALEFIPSRLKLAGREL